MPRAGGSDSRGPVSGDRPRASGPVPRRVPREEPIDVEYEPTLVDVSRQVSMLSQQMSAVLSAVSSNAQQTGFLAERIEGTNSRMANLESRLSGQLSSLHRDVALLRTTQVTDHAPRILDVEKDQKEQQKTRSLVPSAGAVARHAGTAVGSWGLFEVISLLTQHAGPIGQLLKSLGILK
jgi:hypothetical protein